MKEEFDFSKMESRKNPYASALKKQVSIRTDKESKMTGTDRKIGEEILDGLREIKRGEHGRITRASNKSTIREKRKK